LESLKIAIASDWFFPKIGGIESHIDELARHLMETGHEPHVITHDYRYLRPYADSFPYPVERFSAPVYLKKSHISLGAGQLWRINELYKKTGFDITHVHSIYSPLSIAVANLSRGIRDVPVVATNHSFYGNPAADPVLKPVLKRVLKRIDTFIAVSRPVARDTLQLLGESLEGRRVVVVPNGIDTEKWRPPEPEEREKARRALGISDEIVLFYTGRMTERKNAHRLPLIVSKALELSGMARDKVRLLIVGNGEMREKLVENLKKTGLGENTVLFDFLPRERLLEFYWASDIVMVPGILESFSIVGLEASATGRMVVGRDRSGISDLILDGVTGLLGHTEEEVSKKLAWALENPDLVEKMGAEARRRALRNFSWGVVIKKLLRVYRMTMDEADGKDKLYLLYKLSRRIG